MLNKRTEWFNFLIAKLTMKKNILSYSAPEVEVYVVAAERGYGDSVLLPGFGTEDDELVY